MKQKKTNQRWKAIIAIAVALVFVLPGSATFANNEKSTAETMDKLENDGNYVNPSSSQNMDSGDSLFLQLPHDPDESWSMATSDTGAGYIMYENFWDITGLINDIHWWGLALIFTPGGWVAGNPNNLVFDIKFYADDPNDSNLPPDELVATFTDIVPPVITGTGQLYAGFEMYYFDGVELDPVVNLSEGWVSINSKSSGQGEDWLMWASAKTGDGFSYHENGGNPRYFDQAMNLTGVGSKPPAPILEIGGITGKLFKVSAVIKNNGSADATGVNWSITLNGGIILLGKETTGDIICIPAGDEAKISSSLIFGFGKTVITATAECDEGSSDTNTRDAFVFLLFIL